MILLARHDDPEVEEAFTLADLAAELERQPPVEDRTPQPINASRRDEVTAQPYHHLGE